jgi:hypothetical protein
MKWIPTTAIFVVGLGAVAIAQGPVLPSPGLWRQNIDLIRELVDTGVRLAADEDPLSRAHHCQELARHVIAEIQTAATQHDAERMCDLGGHLHDVLKLGITSNLRVVHSETSPSSNRQDEVGRLAASLEELMEPLDQVFVAASKNTKANRQTLAALRAARAEIDRAAKASP